MKKRPNKIFEVTGETDSVIVIARHPKGARTVAQDFIDGVTISSQVEELQGALKSRAVNMKECG